MRPVSSRLILAVAGIAGLTLAGAHASASPGGHHGGFSHSPGHLAQSRVGRGIHIRAVGRGYGAGDFGRAGLGRGFGSGDHVGRHGRFGLGYGFGYGGFGYDDAQLIRSGYVEDAAECCHEAYPTASGIRAAPVAPPAIYVIGARGRHGHLRRATRGVWVQADSALAGYPSRVVSRSGARIIRIP